MTATLTTVVRNRTESVVGTVAFHAKNRETGTVIVVEKTGPGHWLEENDAWMAICESHGDNELFAAKWEAVLAARTPSLFCEDCAKVAGVEFDPDAA